MNTVRRSEFSATLLSDVVSCAKLPFCRNDCFSRKNFRLVEKTTAFDGAQVVSGNCPVCSLSSIVHTPISSPARSSPGRLFVKIASRDFSTDGNDLLSVGEVSKMNRN